MGVFINNPKRHASPSKERPESLDRPAQRLSTEGPSWGYLRGVLGAIGALLSTFGREVPRFPEIRLKIDF